MKKRLRESEIMKLPDVKMEQDQKIAQQVIDRAIRSNKEIAINVFNIGQINNLGNQNNDNNVLKKYLESIPQPRLFNLNKDVISLALADHETQKDAAEWLGISQRAICYQKFKLLKGEE